MIAPAQAVLPHTGCLPHPGLQVGALNRQELLEQRLQQADPLRRLQVAVVLALQRQVGATLGLLG